jgi:hypothetical protein
VPRLSPSGLKPGMITARSVVNGNGMVLLGENAELTAELIDRIKNMDVDSVYVQGAAAPSKSRDEFLAEIESRFRLAGNEPNMDTIKRAVTRHIEGLYA